MRTQFRVWSGGVLLVAAFVLGSTIAEAVREKSWGPMWTTGWIPAVLVALLYSPSSAKRSERCSDDSTG